MNYPEFIAFPKIPRLHRECVITEKIDGTNGVVYITDDGDMFIGSRNRWLSVDSDNFGFHRWATENRDEVMKLGPGRHNGEWWGCLDSETSVKLADGSSKNIGVIVNNQLNVEVMSYNFILNQFEPKKVVGWKRAPATNDWISMTYKRKHRGGRACSVNLTPNHIVYTRRNGDIVEISVSELKIGDKLFLPGESIGHYQRELIRGSILGDGSIRDHIFTSGHSNHEYSKTKARILGSCLSRISESISGKGSQMLNIHTKSLVAVREIEDEIYINGIKNPTEDYIMSLGPVALAFWYMDDGCLNTQTARSSCSSLYVQGFPKDIVCMISTVLQRRGYNNYTITASGGGGMAIRFTPQGTLRLHMDIAPFVSPEMKYKLLPEFQSLANFWDSVEPSPSDSFGLVETEITTLEPTTPRSKVRYDIEVEDNHNFIANGVLVHNSGIQRGYNLPKGEKRVSLFNVSLWNVENLPHCCHVVPTLFTGEFSTNVIDDTMDLLWKYGSVASPGFMNSEGLMVYHSSAGHYFKVPFDKNHKG
jgi:intein/homing endonuclease